MCAHVRSESINFFVTRHFFFQFLTFGASFVEFLLSKRRVRSLQEIHHKRVEEKFTINDTHSTHEPLIIAAESIEDI